MYCLLRRISPLLGQLTDRLGGSEHLGLCVLMGEAESHHPLLHGAECFVDEGRTMSTRPDTDVYKRQAEKMLNAGNVVKP